MPTGKPKFYLKKIGAMIYVLALVLLGGFLFLKDNVDFRGLTEKLGGNAVQNQHQSADKLVIGYSFAPQSLSPLLFDSVTRSRLVDVYEGLVSTDRNLKIKPAIAITWGMLDQNTWEFKLRPNVKFHNGKLLEPEDVLNSLEKARSDQSSKLIDLLNTISKVEISGKDKIVIRTNEPDPLLLNKLAVTYIFPKDLTDFEKPVGTGPYKFVSAGAGGDTASSEILLESFSDYWGKKPYYKQVVLKTISDKYDRTDALENGAVQLLTNVPPSVACSTGGKYTMEDGCSPLQNKNIEFKSIPSLEVNFIVFNFNNSLLVQKEFRSILARALDKNFFVDLSFGYARPSNQFVSSGVFGFNPEIKGTAYNLEEAKSEIADQLAATFDILQLTFDYPQELQAMGEYVQGQFEQLGIMVNLNPLDGASLQQKIAEGKSDMYFLGWKSELGDSFDFLSAIGHSQENGLGQFNFSNYKNTDLDSLIEKNQHNLDEQSRLENLQKSMKILVEDDVIGLPLFESDVIFAFDKRIGFEPRVDGYVHAAEIIDY